MFEGSSRQRHLGCCIGISNSSNTSLVQHMGWLLLHQLPRLGGGRYSSASNAKWSCFVRMLNDRKSCCCLCHFSLKQLLLQGSQNKLLLFRVIWGIIRVRDRTDKTRGLRLRGRGGGGGGGGGNGRKVWRKRWRKLGAFAGWTNIGSVMQVFTPWTTLSLGYPTSWTVLLSLCGKAFHGLNLVLAGRQTLLQVCQDAGSNGNACVLHLVTGVAQETVEVAGLSQQTAEGGHQEHFWHPAFLPQSNLLLYLTWHLPFLPQVLHQALKFIFQSVLRVFRVSGGVFPG